MKSNTYINKYFETHDLGLSSALLTAGFALEHLDKQDPSRVKFVFVREESMDEVIQAYWNNNLKLSLLSFYNNTKVLKNRIYSY